MNLFLPEKLSAIAPTRICSEFFPGGIPSIIAGAIHIAGVDQGQGIQMSGYAGTRTWLVCNFVRKKNLLLSLWGIEESIRHMADKSFSFLPV